MRLPIYLDYMATTPVDPRVKEKLDQCLTIDGNFGNSFSSHVYGTRAKDAIEVARVQVADLINALPDEIIWTSCATEANNLALKGVAKFYSRKGKHIISCQTEHKSVLKPLKHLESQGFDVTYLQPESTGLIDIKKLKEAIRPDTILVSIAFVNSEIGVIQDLGAIGRLIKPKGIIFHVDAVQAAGKTPIDLQELPVDLMAFSAHKVYGPKGIGCLYVRHEPQRIRLEPQMHGGGHELGMRSGTLPTHQIVAMGEAFKIAKEEQQQDCQRIQELQQKLLQKLQAIGGVHINGGLTSRVPHNLNIQFDGIKGEDLIPNLTDIAVSAGSACTTLGTEPSYVLKAIGLSNLQVFNSMRISLGRFTTEEEINHAAEHIKQVVTDLRSQA